MWLLSFIRCLNTQFGVVPVNSRQSIYVEKPLSVCSLVYVVGVTSQ